MRRKPRKKTYQKPKEILIVYRDYRTEQYEVRKYHLRCFHGKGFWTLDINLYHSSAPTFDSLEEAIMNISLQFPGLDIWSSQEGDLRSRLFYYQSIPDRWLRDGVYFKKVSTNGLD